VKQKIKQETPQGRIAYVQFYLRYMTGNWKKFLHFEVVFLSISTIRHIGFFIFFDGTFHHLWLITLVKRNSHQK
jgi:hypothetical protein